MSCILGDRTGREKGSDWFVNKYLDAMSVAVRFQNAA
jgi:hypothetical protein